jgi:hypothetical protein
LPSNEEDALFGEEGEGHLLGNTDEQVVHKENQPLSKRYTTDFCPPFIDFVKFSV